MCAAETIEFPQKMLIKQTATAVVSLLPNSKYLMNNDRRNCSGCAHGLLSWLKTQHNDKITIDNFANKSAKVAERWNIQKNRSSK